MSNIVEDFPVFYDHQFTDSEEYHFEAEGIALPLYDIMFWEDDFDTIEDFYAYFLLPPITELRVETAEMTAVGAIPESNKVIVNIRGVFY